MKEKSMNFLRFRDLEAGDCFWSSGDASEGEEEEKNVGQMLARNSDENFLIKSFNLDMDTTERSEREKEFADSVKRPAASTNLHLERFRFEFQRIGLALFMEATSFFREEKSFLPKSFHEFKFVRQLGVSKYEGP